LAVEIEPGKTSIIKFWTVDDPYPGRTRTVFFELNAQPRDVAVTDTDVRI
jgi:pyruvate carboxylase